MSYSSLLFPESHSWLSLSYNIQIWQYYYGYMH